MKTIQILSILLTILVIMNLILFVSGKINDILFWVIMGLSALVAYKVVPKLKK